MVRSTGAGAFLVMLLLSLLRQTAGFAPMVSLAGQRPPPVLSTARATRLRGSREGLSMAADVTDANFREKVIQSSVPTLVSFWAPWCGPCRMIKPVLEQIQEEYAGKLMLCQINTDENQETATEYGIRSIPTLILFKDGLRVDTIIGALMFYAKLRCKAAVASATAAKAAVASASPSTRLASASPPLLLSFTTNSLFASILYLVSTAHL